MNNRFLRFLQFVLVGLDLVGINVMTSVVFLYFQQHIPVGYYSEYLKFVLVLNISWLVVCYLKEVYSGQHITQFEPFFSRSVKAYFFWMGSVLVILFLTHQFQLSRIVVAVTLVLTGLVLPFNRFIYLMIHYYLKRRRVNMRRIMIVGYNEMSKKLVSYFEQQGPNIEIIGFCEYAENVHELTAYPVLASPAGAMRESRAHQVNEIYCSIAPEQNESIYGLMKDADNACIRFRLIPDLSAFVNRPIHIDYLKDIPVISLHNEPLNDAENRIKKRLFDILFSMAVILFILSWLVPLIAILILLDSGGPVFFRQWRSGKNNKNFRCFKFCSMRANAESETRQATADDERFTRIGRFLRRTNLDEFPQFLNVLLGDMSIVGPRPHMLKQTEDYSKLINQYMIRQFLKPGITGWAQVNGLRGETKTLTQMRERVEHDIWYMENWSIWLDLRIILMTIYSTIRGDKNAF